jgi:hypothetical protein
MAEQAVLFDGLIHRVETGSKTKNGAAHMTTANSIFRSPHGDHQIEPTQPRLHRITV